MQITIRGEVLDSDTGLATSTADGSTRPLTAREQELFAGTAALQAVGEAQATVDGNRRTLADRALAAYVDNRAFITRGATNTNVQVRDQVIALTKQMNALARVVFDRLDSTDGT